MSMTLTEICPMTRPGRKRKHANREPNGRAQRQPAQTDRGTEEFQAHRARAVGEAHKHDARAGDPLGILELAGVVTASERAAAARWAEAMWAVYGRPDPSGAPLERKDRGHGDGPGPAIEQRARAGIDALRSVGHDAYAYVRRAAVELILPGWYRRDHVRPADLRKAAEFIAGLRALESVIGER